MACLPPYRGVYAALGFLLLGPHDEVDRPPDGTLYRPLASRVYLMDGEIFPLHHPLSVPHRVLRP